MVQRCCNKLLVIELSCLHQSVVLDALNLPFYLVGDLSLPLCCCFVFCFLIVSCINVWNAYDLSQCY
uniref:Uncharacterized protein n=1 Tax=Anguilla anguilla TaxID=7936 RepID=A0A0E9Q3X3_ANGAN